MEVDFRVVDVDDGGEVAMPATEFVVSFLINVGIHLPCPLYPNLPFIRCPCTV